MTANSELSVLPPPRSSRRNRRVCVSSATKNPCRLSRTKLDKQYRARSYSEMMQISDVYDRLALYEKTFELCMRADPQLTAWIQRVKSKGPPKPLMEGYAPPLHLKTSVDSSDSASRKPSSLSLFLRKASSVTTSRPPPPTLSDAPKSSASRFLTTSLSRLSSLSRSTSQRVSSASSVRRSVIISCPEPSPNIADTLKIGRRLSRDRAPMPQPATSLQSNKQKRSSTEQSSLFLDRLRLRKSRELVGSQELIRHKPVGINA